ncbi:MAG: HD domain-containing protein [Clostridia bacterium]|nr:HD domain-containing protein [Clostridia bacterium]
MSCNKENLIKSTVFFKIYSDESIRLIYDEIKNIEEDTLWAHHDITHVNNVVSVTEKVLIDMNCDQELIENAKIAAYMHDVGALQGKSNHAYRSYEFAKRYFEENSIDLKYKTEVLEAIKNHSEGFDTDNIIQSALIFADKIDIKSSRPTRAGLMVEGMRQMQYIDDINVKIDSSTISVNFICNRNINKQELEQYYFMKKVGNSIKSFARKFNLKYNVCFNSNSWEEIL